MRPDFPKLLCERERRGSYKSYREVRRAEGALQLGTDEDGVESDAPRQRSMSKPQVAGYNGKELSENLNPLKNWLLKNVGRPWNKVYSELRAQFKPTSAINAHIYQHLFSYVELHATINDKGEVCSSFSFAWREPRPLRHGDLYVDKHGILCNPKKRRTNSKPARVADYVAVDQSTALAKIDGIWYYVTTRKREKKYDEVRQSTYSSKYTWTTPVFESHHNKINPYTVFGWPDNIVAVGRKQLSTKELRRHSLANDQMSA